MFQQAPGLVEVPLGSARRNTQQLPDLFVFEAVEYKEVEHKGCIAWQLLQEPHYVMRRKPVINIGIDGVVVARYDLEGLMVEFCLPAKLVDAGIDHDAAHPAHPVAATFILMKGIEYFQHAFVEQGCGFIGIPRIAGAHFDHARIAGPVQRFLAFGILLFTAFNDVIPVC